MLKHENPNIEIIAKNLYAVRFSLIPMIPQLDWKPDPSTDWNKVHCQFSTDCKTVFLNKDFKFYPLVQKAYSSIIRMKPKQIRKELDKITPRARSGPWEIVYWGCLKAELERRKMMKGGVG